ncbi:MAG: hypothetical protein GTN82_14380 [Candidatus Aminicenantes bacterium]|nr:hypothetical protein [Candidatus Aminicenantes bacterium]
MSEKKERNIAIAIKVLNGASYAKVGKEYGINGTRVWQIFFRVCLRAVHRGGLRDKLPEEWYHIKNARQHKELIIKAIEEVWR